MLQTTTTSFGNSQKQNYCRLCPAFQLPSPSQRTGEVTALSLRQLYYLKLTGMASSLHLQYYTGHSWAHSYGKRSQRWVIPFRDPHFNFLSQSGPLQHWRRKSFGTLSTRRQGKNLTWRSPAFHPWSSCKPAFSWGSGPPPVECPTGNPCQAGRKSRRVPASTCSQGCSSSTVSVSSQPQELTVPHSYLSLPDSSQTYKRNHTVPWRPTSLEGKSL